MISVIKCWLAKRKLESAGICPKHLEPMKWQEHWEGGWYQCEACETEEKGSEQRKIAAAIARVRGCRNAKS